MTGLLPSRRPPAFRGLFESSNGCGVVLTVKQLLVLAVTAIALYRGLVAGRRDLPPTPKQDKLISIPLVPNLVVGVAALPLSAVSTALSAPPSSSG